MCALVLTFLSGCAGKPQNEQKNDEDAATVTAVADILETEEATDEKSEPAEAEVELEDEKVLGEFSFRLPKGFIPFEEEEGVFVCKDYPKKIACVSYLIADFDGNKEEASEEILKGRLEKDLLDNYGETVEIKVTDYQEYDIDGCDTVKIEASFTLMKTDYELIQIFINNGQGQESYAISYIQEAKAGWMDAFHDSIDSISFDN